MVVWGWVLRLNVGKLPYYLLEKYVFKRTGAQSSRVLVGPGVGEDAAVVDFGDRLLVFHSDPITGAVENLGFLAVNVAANDVASKGADPLWASITLLLSEGLDEGRLDELTEQLHETALELGISIVGGHTEVVYDLTRPIVVVTVVGEAEKEKFKTTGGAQVGDAILMTKGAALEGTAIVASEFEFLLSKCLGKDVVQRAKQFLKEVSVLKEAKIARELPEVHAMHDATEGGILCAVQEMALASGLGAEVYEHKIIVRRETKSIFSFIGADPLKAVSSGSLIIAVDPSAVELLRAKLNSAGIECEEIGKFVERSEGFKLVKSDGSVLDFSEPVKEELWSIYDKLEWLRSPSSYI